MAPWDLLVRNAALPALVKFVFLTQGGLQLRAELPLSEDAGPAERIRETCEGLVSALSLPENSAQSSAPEPSLEKIDLKGLCREAGWPFIERGPDKLLVELEMPNHFWQAAIIPAGRGIHLSCELTALDSLAEESRGAIATFLLSASGALRLARAAVGTNGTRLEVAFSTLPTSHEISSALESLSVGCSLCGEETKMLLDPAIARRFQALRSSLEVSE